MKIPWWDAMKIATQNQFQGKSDWRLPTNTEMDAIVGSFDACLNLTSQAKSLAVSSLLASPIDNENHQGIFWSSSAYFDYLEQAYSADFGSGDVSWNDRGRKIHVRLVRGGKSTGLQEFKQEFAKIAGYKSAYLAGKLKEERQAKQAALEAKRKKQEEAKENKSNSAQIVQEIIQRCRIQMSGNGAAIVKTCVDQDIQALSSIGLYLKKFPGIMNRCYSQMKQYGYAIVKVCADQDIAAEEALSRY